MTTKNFQAMYYAARLLHPKVKVSSRIPMAIAMQETQLGLTGVGVSCNNLFGMNKPLVRKTTATGATTKGIAVFDSQAASIKDFLYFLDQLGKYTDDDLMAYITSGKYNTNKAYPPLIERIIAQQAPEYIPFAKFAATAAGAAVGVACGVKVLTVLAKKI